MNWGALVLLMHAAAVLTPLMIDGTCGKNVSIALLLGQTSLPPHGERFLDAVYYPRPSRPLIHV